MKSGVRVIVPFGKQKMMVGLAVRIHDKEPEFKVKDITRVLDTTPIVTEDQLRMWNWIADYYMSPIGEVFNAALPAGLKAEDGFRPKTETYVTLPENLRHEQALHIAFGMLKRALAQLKTFNTYLTLSHWDTIVGDCTDEPVVEVTKDELINESHATAGVMKQLLDKKMLVTYEKEVGRLNCGGGHGTRHLECFSLSSHITASEYEASYAKLEGVNFIFNKKPLEITDKGVVFIDLNEAEDGTLTEIPGTEKLYPADSVIVSISQGPCTTITDSTKDLKTTPRGLFETDEVGRTSIPGIFASGDAVKGARTVVEAVAYSKNVAEAMHEYMQTLPPDLPDEYANVPVAEYDEGN